MRVDIPPLDKIDIRLLKVFKAVTECNGLAAAEETLNLSRSTISIHISDLETRFGIKLCSRGPGGFSLTPEGSIVYDATLRLFNELNNFRSTVAGSKGKLMGELSIWLMDNMATDPKNPLGAAIRKFRSRPNEVQLTVNVVPSNDVERAVYDGRCDLGITGSKTDLVDLLYEKLHTESITLYCGSEHPLFAFSDDVEDEHLVDLDFIRRGFVAPKHELVETDWASSVSAMHTEATLQLILTGLHVGYLPEHYAVRWEKEGKVKKINEKRFRVDWPVYLVSRASDRQSVLLASLRNDILDCAQAKLDQQTAY
ncbi:LysR family transcriptional regulator [Ochrobactrum sp. MYb15]|uniref:LysR family transcriptional regulator n=1 Tax=Brucella pituitosa TaxID=571256 RepID=UPI000CFCE5BD|nr:LysR family transcriptional regulator [Ochrobactrum sp. MYb19]PRA60589.1 LysR family transcriptional regulator [Ochrobactrum sp. MYb18]PRA73456.1 LysR family transcriptional regulator [Brucella thiophenivorans]PRA85433.1 LysR family transcriptional regulator [Ochrobactrum sp. MYb14]PRA94979.1 LysR family transcriptional regulator [Ochrobactrum sp. MYb15]